MRHLQLQHHAAALEVGAGVLDHLAQHRRQLHILHRDRAAFHARIGQQVVDQLPHAQRAFLDALGEQPALRIELLLDDLIATGGTLLAAARLIRRMGAELFEAAAIIDLPELGGSQKLQDMHIPTFTLTAFALDDR